MSSFNAVSAYFSQKRVTGSQLLNLSVFSFISILLIYGGVLILQSENIFKKVYEGFDVPAAPAAPAAPAESGTERETETESRTGTPTTGTPIRGTPTRESRSTATTWTADLPEDLTLAQLQKNVNLIRKQSNMNVYTGTGMIVTGSLILLYQTYSLFF
jgi:hypothetical protein